MCVYVCVNRIWHYIAFKGWYAIKHKQIKTNQNKPFFLSLRTEQLNFLAMHKSPVESRHHWRIVVLWLPLSETQTDDSLRVQHNNRPLHSNLKTRQQSQSMARQTYLTNSIILILRYQTFICFAQIIYIYIHIQSQAHTYMNTHTYMSIYTYI